MDLYISRFTFENGILGSCANPVFMHTSMSPIASGTIKVSSAGGVHTLFGRTLSNHDMNDTYPVHFLVSKPTFLSHYIKKYTHFVDTLP